MSVTNEISPDAQELLRRISDQEAKTPSGIRKLGLSVQAVAQQFGAQGGDLLSELYDWEYLDFVDGSSLALLTQKGRASAPYRIAEEPPNPDAAKLIKALYETEQALPPRQQDSFGLLAVAERVLGPDHGLDVLRWLNDHDYCTWHTTCGADGALTEKARQFAVRG